MLNLVCAFGCVLLLGSVCSTQIKSCEEPPAWTIQGQEVMKNLKGNVTFLALLDASSPYSRSQAFRMQLLHEYCVSLGMDKLSFIIVNTYKGSSASRIDQLTSKVTTVKVYQETAAEQVWSTLGGKKEDIFIYDKCGKLTFHIPLPLSIISTARPTVQTAVIHTYTGNICGATC